MSEYGIKKILVVDDTPLVRKMIRSIFDNEKWETYEAGDGDTAIDIYKNKKPDIVTMDISMLGKDGIETTREIIKFDKNAKIIMVSASSEKTLILKAMQAGAKNFIVKPLDPTKLINVVNEVLNS